jgi:hypothetical protein
LCVQLLDWKGGQTSSFDQSCMVWVIGMIIGTISTSILTKHTYGKDNMCLWKTFKNQKHGTLHYTKYAQGCFLLMGFLYLFVRAIFVCVPFHWGFHITLFTFQEFRHMCMCYVHNLVWHFIFTLMFHPMNPHQIQIWKGGFCWALDLIDCDLGIQPMLIH